MARSETGGRIGLLQSTAWTFNAAESVFGSAIQIDAFLYGKDPQAVLFVNAAIEALSVAALPLLREPSATLEDLNAQA
jgi:hypothetical protein